MSSWYPGEVHPTLGNFVQRHAEAVALRNEVYVLYISRVSDPAVAARLEWKKGLAVCFEEQQGVHVVLVYYKHRFNAPRALWAGWRALQTRWSVKMDVIHHHVLWPGIWQAVWMKRHLKIPLVVTEHWTGFLSDRAKLLSWWQKWYLRQTVKQADCLIPVTDNLARAMKGLNLTGRYEVVPNVVDVDLFRDVPKTASTYRFLHISSLHDDQKNITGLLRTWKAFSDAQPQVVLEIGGDGPWQHWKEQAGRMNIREGSIDFFGTLTWSEVAAKMEAAHVLVLFSRYENLPCVIVEALASGLRIISTRVGGIAEHITEERGTLIDSEDEKALLRAFHTELHTLPHRSALRAYAEQHFSKRAIAEAFHRVYVSVMNSGQSEK